MLLWRVQRAAGAVASRCGGRLAHIRAMATVPGSSSAVKQGKHTINDTEFIAYRYTAPTAADKPCVVFLHGLCSNMSGTKALALEQHAAAKGYGCLCFDTRGHGSSSGTFEGTNIGDWYSDTQAAVLQLAGPHKKILVGSSLGGWLALQLALDHPAHVSGLLLIAPALDFTEAMWSNMSQQQQETAQREGRIQIASNYMDPVHAGLQLISEGRKLLLLERLESLHLTRPVHILHGVQDDAVPVSVSQRLFAQLPNPFMSLTLVKDGDHRLARPGDMLLMLSTLDTLVQQCCAQGSCCQ